MIVVHVLVPSDLSEEQAELAAQAGRVARAPQPALRGGGGEESFFSRVRRAFG